MSMTKKERAEFDAALKQARELGALRWTSPVAKDVPPPAGGATCTQGWAINSYDKGVVYEAWSDSFRHGRGRAPAAKDPYCPASQGCISLYSTKLLALKALRHEMEKEAAQRLAAIDSQIAAEESA